jgi:hypothetical protein
MKRRKLQPKKRPPQLPPAEQDLKATSGAVFGLEEERPPDTQGPNESIEDPLQDWPEDSGEPDQWLDERRGSRGEPES